MENRELVCTVCPNGCHLTVVRNDDGTVSAVEGARCDRGRAFGKQEVICPQLVLTSTVLVHTADGDQLLPVRSADAFALNLHGKAMEVLRHTAASSPIKMGDVIVENIVESGTNIIASCSIR